MKNIFFIILFPFLLQAEINWQADLEKPFTVSITLNADKVYRNEFIYLTAYFDYPFSYEFNNDQLTKQLGWSANPLAPQFILHQTTFSQSMKDDMVRNRIHAIIRPQTIGEISLTFLKVSFEPREKTEKTIEVLTPVFTIQVLPPQGNQTPLTIAPPMPLEPEFPLGLTEANRHLLWESPEQQEAAIQEIRQAIRLHTFPWVTLAFLIGLAGIGWVIYLMRDRLPKWKRRKLPPLSPKDQAEKALRELQQNRRFDEDPLFATAALSSILLQALGGKFNQNLTKYTTPELAHAFQRQDSLSLEQREAILLVFSQLDRIKFAGKTASPTELHEFIQKIQNIVSGLWI